MLALLLVLAQADGIVARWRCDPAEVEVGEPFALVLELAHGALPPGVAPRELAGGTLALDGSWVVFDDGALASGPGLTARTWRVASLEPGERPLGEALSAFALSDAVTRIALGDAVVRVAGVLEPGEDAPRPLRELPRGFADVDAAGGAPSRAPWLVAGIAALAALALAVALVLRRRARRLDAAPAPSPLERLVALESALEERARESCYELTRLLRESADRAHARERAGMTDEEWLAALAASRELSPEALSELEAVMARAARVKYAGDAASPWALKETFERARGALAALASTPGPTGTAEASR